MILIRFGSLISNIARKALKLAKKFKKIMFFIFPLNYGKYSEKYLKYII